MVVSKKTNIEFEPSKNVFFFHGNFHTNKTKEGTISVPEIRNAKGTAYGEVKGGARPGAVDALKGIPMGAHVAIPWERMGDFLW